MTSKKTIEIEDRHTPPFFNKIQISIDRGEGVYVWDEEGTRYLDFTSGWGVTSIGHAHSAITNALQEQGQKILQNPNSGLTYSPARARLLDLLAKILPAKLTRVFFSNSGAEANDAAIKMARKVTGRSDVISTEQSFHGRTISTASATGQASHRSKFNPLMPNYKFVPFNDIAALKTSMDSNTAAVILEPVQGEGGVQIPSGNYLEDVSKMCKANGSLLIIDEIQTGFCRTGPLFAISSQSVEPDFMTMAKGIAGGFPIGAFAVTDHIAAQFEVGDHGGTYCGNPLGCAVAYAVVNYLVENDISSHVIKLGDQTLERMRTWIQKYPGLVTRVRGQGLLLLMELSDAETATKISDYCQGQHLFVRQTQGNAIRIFPALNIKDSEMEEGLLILEKALESMAN
ncbi:MAG: aspartate aminotransferase family protein [SAR324 cluster bacterium]|nr:aspartate aminotransferase family protein [SAR324 cluster bacterium]